MINNGMNHDAQDLYGIGAKQDWEERVESEIERNFQRLCHSRIKDETALANYRRYKAKHRQIVLEGYENAVYPYIMREAFRRYLDLKGIEHE